MAKRGVKRLRKMVVSGDSDSHDVGKRARVQEVENPSPASSRDESEGSSEPSHSGDETKESSEPSNCSHTENETHGSTSSRSSTRNETQESNSDDQSGEDLSGEDQSTEETKNSGSTHDLSQDEGSIQSNQLLGEFRRKCRHDKQAAPLVSNSTNDADASGDEDPEALSAPERIKLIDLNTYGFKTHVSVYGSFRSRVCVRSPLGGKPFADFRQLLQDQGIENDFRSSCFGHFLEIPKANFASKIVHALLLNRIYCDKKKEVWFNVNGLPLRFGLNEFALMTGLRCHPPPDTSSKKMIKYREKGQAFWELISKDGKTVTTKFLYEKIKSNDLSQHDKLSVALVWFLHAILLAKDSSTSVDSDDVRLAWKHKVFNRQPWGHKSYKLIVSYLEKKLAHGSEQYNLYGFPWAFMAWAFEAVPALAQMAKKKPERTMPRMIGWMSYGGLVNNFPEPFRPNDQRNNDIVNPFLIPTNAEKKKYYMQRLEPFTDEISDERIDGLKEVLEGVTAIKFGDDIAATNSPLRSTGGETMPPNDGDRAGGYSPVDNDLGGAFESGGIDFVEKGGCGVGESTGEVLRSRRASIDGPSIRQCSCECAKNCETFKKEVEKMGQTLDSMEKTLKSLVDAFEGLNKKVEPRRTVQLSRYKKSPYITPRKTRKKIVVQSTAPSS